MKSLSEFSLSHSFIYLFWFQGAASGGLLGPPWPLLRRWPGRLQAPTRGWAEAWQEPKPHAVAGCWMILDLDLGDCHAGKSMYKWLWVRVQYGAIVISDRWGWGSDRLRKGEMCWDSCVHLMPWDFCGNFSLAIQDLHVCGNGIHNSWILQISWRALSQARPQVRWHPKRTGCHLQGVKMCEDVWRCVKICGDVWRCVEMCEDVWRCVKICEDVWRCVKMCEDVWRCEDLWRCVEMCGDVWRCVKMCEAVWRFVKMCGDVWRCVKMCGDVWRCLRICEDVWRCVEMCEDVSGSALKCL